MCRNPVYRLGQQTDYSTTTTKIEYLGLTTTSSNPYASYLLRVGKGTQYNIAQIDTYYYNKYRV